GGRDLDIFDINDGMQKKDFFLSLYDYSETTRQGRNSIIGDQYRWPRTVPYYMEDDLEINAKGVILKAFEQYRLKTCIDFKPWNGEKNYISIFKGGGGKQRLSIGTNCDRIATIEHEFLHALGFWHEQSRSDRDDYVTIISLGVPYDYGSMMHYSKNAFRNGTEPTIVTKIPAFSDVIGQRMEFSDSDLLKLSRLYNCTKAATFLDSCDFERENICGMIQGPGDMNNWMRVSSAAGGPNISTEQMYPEVDFMHFETGSANTGANALLESRLLYPKRGYQCLQFFYYNSAGPTDTLKIHVREYDKENPNGKLRYITTIDGAPQELWQLHHVSLNVTKKFRVVRGMSLDDINLSETTCPEFIWRVKNFSHVIDNTPMNTPIFSPPFTSKEGYTFQMQLYPSGKAGYPGELSAYAHLVARQEDTGQTWPCPWKQMTMMLMDQHPHIQKRMSNQRSVTTDPNMKATDSEAFFWDDPRKVGVEVTADDGSKYFRGPGSGTAVYLTHLRAKSRDFIKGGDAIFLLTMEGKSIRLHYKYETLHLNQGSQTCGRTFQCGPWDELAKCKNSTVKNDGICVVDVGPPACRCAVGDDWWYYGDSCQYKGSTQDKTTLALASSLSVLAVMAVITAVSVICVKESIRREVGRTIQSWKIEASDTIRTGRSRTVYSNSK
uniref:Metalloendopeptidase n=1 Tax=Sphaeramia orbicularis TaxID=375764 RepID=A0A672Y8H6_9TELE